jgi:DNA-binding CsgD family transcriptional regulator
MLAGSAMTDDVTMLARARELFAQRAWTDAFRLFQRIDARGGLEVDDLDRLATAAYLAGRDDDHEAARARAQQACLDRGDREGAARCAFWLAFGVLQRGARAVASGWFARAERMLDEAQLDCVVRGYLLIPSAIQRLAQGDAAGADAAFEEVGRIAARFVDRELASFACHGRGRARIRLGHIGEGAALLDEAMVAVIANDVSPMLAGDIYCSVLEACQEIFDLRRAYEWTMSLAKWCAAQPGIVRYHGECLVYRAEVMQLRGNWREAARDAEEACEVLASRPAAGAAFYRIGEIHRLRGDFTAAEAAYARANERGRTPQPGLALLRLAQGHIAAAAASIGGVLLDTRARAHRARALAAAVEIRLASGDRDGAREAATELSDLARTLATPMLLAASAHATGALLLAEGDIASAAASLRQAADAWRDLGMPYEEAQTCALMASVCERRGDREGRRLELDHARTIFTRLDVAPGVARGADSAGRGSRPPAGALSEREAQVLRLLAAGKTNRDIGDALFISEKTVARHVSNIFDKLGVSSRTAATAWAYQRDLV